MISKPKRMPKYLRNEEVQELIHNTPTTVSLLIQLLYYGGMRITECIKLTKDDINLDKRSIYINRYISKRGKEREELREELREREEREIK